MHYHLVISLVAFFAIFYSWFYIFGLHRHSASNRAFLVFTGVLGLNIALELVAFMPAAQPFIMETIRARMFLWEWVGLLALFFVHRFVRRPFDMLFWTGLVITAIGSLITGLTDLVLNGYTSHPWGFAATFHDGMHFFAALIPGTFAMVALFYLLTAVSQSRRRAQQFPILLVSIGATLSILSVGVHTVVLPDLLGNTQWPQDALAPFVILVACVFIAMTRFNFISLSVENVAEEFFEDVNEGIALVGTTGQINKLNKKAREILALDDRTLTGQGAEHVIPGYAPTDGPRNVKVEFKTNGELHHLFISQSPVKRQEFEVAEIVLIRDITEQEHAEELLKKANTDLEAEARRRAAEIKGTEKTEAIGMLAGGVAHDFNNLLTAILVFAGGARDDLGPGHPNAEDLSEVLTAAERARDISKQLLVFSRKDTAQRRPLGVLACIDDAIRFIEAGLPSRIQIQQRQGPEMNEVKLLGDTNSVRQALVNVLTNSYQAMTGRTGVIRVDSRLAKDAEIAQALRETMIPGRYVLIDIIDEGRGIPAELLPKVFEPMFTHGANSTATGLGLTTTQRIVAEMGGALTIASTVDQGTTVSLYLPTIDSLMPGKAAAGTSLISGKQRICWVDDHEQVPRLGRRFLAPLGFAVSDFNNAQDALRAIQADPHYFDLLISDIDMPTMSGIALTRKALESNRDLPIILLTGGASATARRDAAKLGVKHFLEKPLDIKELEAALIEEFGKRSETTNITRNIISAEK